MYWVVITDYRCISVVHLVAENAKEELLVMVDSTTLNLEFVAGR